MIVGMVGGGSCGEYNIQMMRVLSLMDELGDGLLEIHFPEQVDCPVPVDKELASEIVYLIFVIFPFTK